MVELQAILKYQEIDKKLYALERELAGCEERKEYLKTKKFLETAADKLDAFDAKAAQLKSAAVELTKKYLKTNWWRAERILPFTRRARCLSPIS